MSKTAFAMSKTAFALAILVLPTVVFLKEVAFAKTDDLRVAQNRANDAPNSGICPNGKRVRDLRNCPAQNPKH
jgi:hypothetical protein